MVASVSDATSGNARATPRPSTAPVAAEAVAAATAQHWADMVTSADFATFQQQLRQEVADVMQQLGAEVNEAISGRMDMLNRINTVLQKVSAKTSRVQTISDLRLHSGKLGRPVEMPKILCQESVEVDPDLLRTVRQYLDTNIGARKEGKNPSVFLIV